MNRFCIFTLAFGLAANVAAGPETDNPDPNAAEPTVPDGETPLTLREAEGLALDNNLDIEIARTDPAIAQQTIREALGAYDPVVFASHSFNHVETPNANALLNPTTGSDDWNYSGGLRGLLPPGLSYSSSYNQRRFESDSPLVTLAREWRANWTSELVLPLLRDLYNNDASLAVKRSRLGKQLSNEEFRRSLTEIIQGVDTAYWELSAARAGQHVAEKSLQTASDLLDQTQVQYEVGVVSKVLVTQAEAGVAEREFDLVVARNRAKNAQDELLNIILAPGIQAFASTRIRPEPPTYVDYQADLAEALEIAFARRPELEAARAQVEDAELQLDYALNQRMPRFDLKASYAADGLSGPAKPASQVFGGGTTIDLGDSSDADNKFFRADGAHSWSLSANLEVPLGNRSAKSRVAQRRIELRRRHAELRSTEQGVILEVRNAVRGLFDATDAVEAARRRKTAQLETLRAEQERLRLGDSTPFQVLEFDQDLAEAEQQEITALQSYRVAITAIEKSQGMLLEARRISIEEELSR